MSQKLSIGIVGLPNVGKSTLFKALTKQAVHIANYPFATIDPNVGVVAVPDDRLERLAKISKSKKIIPAVVEFYDIAGLVKGASKGEGLGNQFLSHIRETQAIVVVLRVFKDDRIIHIEQAVDPLRDLEIVETELALKDIETLDKRLKKLEGEAKSGDKQAIKNFEIAKRVRAELEKGGLALPFRGEDIVRELQLLTAKRQLVLLNGREEEVALDLVERIKALGGDFIVANLGDAEAVPGLISKAYEVLDLISFLTTGDMETRAWTIERGTKAPQAAGVIHTDFEKNFIRAEVIRWEELLEAGSWSEARQKGLIRLEGKEYVVEDGDVMVIRHAP
ncbi:redox-regulated ATPase YchF [Candidatus Parcubacteria bacterium]|nr:MAG: redox-regulated ATPase YchF [Candidatus Parcubacteria bacterium]